MESKFNPNKDRLHIFRLMKNVGWFSGKPKPEATICIALARIMRDLSLDGVYRGSWGHIPNEATGKAGKASMALRLGMGMILGQPDYFFITPRDGGGFNILYLEVKAAKGKQSQNQKDYQQWAESAGITYVVADSLLGCINALVKNGVVNKPVSFFDKYLIGQS